MELTVLTQNGCVPCQFVKNYLNDNDVEYKSINVSEDSSAIQTYNIMSTPVTVLSNEGEEVARVSGYNPDELNLLIEQL